ncbi:MAG: hypothetical protein AAF458_03220 [Pseudomonadota bacterium]
MPIVVSAQQALENRRENTFKQGIAKPFHRRLYMGSEPNRGGTVESEKLSLPQAYLVEQPSESTVAPHFHDTNQFQVFVRGDGLFGRKPVNGLTIHYARAHTAYGPIVARDSDVHYLTLRNCWDSGAKILPENRSKMQKIERLHRIVEDVHVPDPVELSTLRMSRGVDVVPLEDDGLGVRRFDLPPAGGCALGFEQPGAGAYAFVINGQIVYDDLTYEAHSLLYTGPDEAPLQVSAGGQGAIVLLLQFPPEPAELSA